MGKIVNLMLALVAYACVATLITLASTIGYWWYTERLTDDKLFRIMALLHDVDLNRIAEAHRKTGAEVPPEEPSLLEITHHQQVLDRNHEVKLLALQRGIQEYHHQFQLLKEQADRNDRLAQDLQSRLKQHVELTTQENVAKVVSQLERLQPEVAKQSLMRWIEEGRMDDAILLMGKMSERQLSKILKSFETDQELDKLHEIHQRMLASGAGAAQLQKALNELQPAPAGNQPVTRTP
jgi:hypothetical protein